MKCRVYAPHVAKRPSKRSALVDIIIPCEREYCTTIGQFPIKGQITLLSNPFSLIMIDMNRIYEISTEDHSASSVDIGHSDNFVAFCNKVIDYLVVYRIASNTRRVNKMSFLLKLIHIN